MCRAMEEMRKDERINVAIKLLKLGKLTCEEIDSAANLSVSEVEKLDKQKSA